MDAEQAARRIKALRDEIKADEEEVKELIAEHFSHLSEGKSEVVGEYVVEARPVVRFDVPTALKLLTEEEIKRISVTKPDSKLAKEFLSPEEYALVQKHFAPSIRVGLPEDLED